MRIKGHGPTAILFAGFLVLLGLQSSRAVGQPQICPYPDGTPAALIQCTGGFLNTATATATPTTTTTVTATPAATATPTPTPLWPGFEQPGLDPAYGDHGIAWLARGFALRDADILPDGKILTLEQDGAEQVITRWTPLGQLDPTFHGTGQWRINLPLTIDLANLHLGQIAAAPNDQFVLAFGVYTATSDSTTHTFTRVNPGGWLDLDFGHGTWVTAGSHFRNTWSPLIDLHRLSDGSVAFVQDENLTMLDSFGTLNMAVVYYSLHIDCTPWPSTDPCFPGRMAVLDDGTALVPQGTWTSTLITRMLPSGELDNGFGLAGRANLPGQTALAAAVDSTGRVYGATRPLNDLGTILITRLLSDGTLDSSWGAAGQIAISTTIALNRVYPYLAVDAQDRLMLGGVSTLANRLEFRRFLEDGSADAAFGAQGLRLPMVGTGSSPLNMVAWLEQPDGGWVAVTTNEFNGQAGFALVRLASDVAVPTRTPTPFGTLPSPTSTATASATATRTATAVVGSTATSTVTRTATRTVTFTSTASSTPSPSFTPSATRTSTPSPTPTLPFTPTRSPTPTVTAAPSVTASVVATATSSPTMTSTATNEPTETPTTVATVLPSTPSPSSARTLDPDYGVSGQQVLAGTLQDGRPVQVWLAPQDGTLWALVFGRDAQGIYRYGLLHYTADGKPDPAFGTMGQIIIAEPQLTNLELVDFAVGTDGDITVVGSATPIGSSEVYIVVLRRTASGVPDAAFGVNGLAVITAIGEARARTVERSEQGFLIGGQVISNGSPGTGVILRVTNAGNLEASFGGQGVIPVVSSHIPNDQTLVLRALISNPNGLIALGQTETSGLLAWRWDDCGVPDAGFGDAGEWQISLPGEDAQWTRTADGGFYLLRLINVDPATVTLLVRRYDSQGQLQVDDGTAGTWAYPLRAGTTIADVLASENQGVFLLLVGPTTGVQWADSATVAETVSVMHLAADGRTATLEPLTGASSLVGEDLQVWVQPDGALVIRDGTEVRRLVSVPTAYQVTLPQIVRP